GRFADVSGSAKLDAVGFPDFTFTLSGDISYCARDRKTPAPVNELPLNLSGSGRLLFDPTATLSGKFETSGLASYLGPWTNSGDITFTPMSATTLYATGSVTFRGVGSTITMTFSGDLDVTTGKATGTFTITGGTGRCKGASGTLALDLTQHP